MSVDWKKILSQKPFLELCDECKECPFNKNPNNKNKPCNYEYCDRGDKSGRMEK